MIATTDYEFDLQDEVDRKLLETCQSFEYRHQTGELSDRAYFCALQALYKALNGLACSEATDWLEEQLVLLKSDYHHHSILRKGEKLLILSRLNDDPQFQVHRAVLREGERLYDFDEFPDGVKLVKKAMNDLINGSISLGFKEV